MDMSNSHRSCLQQDQSRSKVQGETAIRGARGSRIHPFILFIPVNTQGFLLHQSMAVLSTELML